MIAMSVEGLDRLCWDDMFPRKFRQGEAIGWCGESFIVVISSPFTADEDAVFEWVMKQDVVELVGVLPCSDGRDLLMFDRCFIKQSREDARKEQVDFIRQALDREQVRVDLVVSNVT